jgi:serine/threonine protein kinase/tetratricopeptide (TPR) repeat protein
MNEPACKPSAQPEGESPATATADEELLADLADDFAARLRRGEHPAVEEYVAKHPALAERIRNVLSAAAMMEQTRAFDSAPAGEGPGTIIGRYKLLERIGEGGFGVVYMAEQQQPVRRKVALKVVKPGMDSRQVLARFEAERQALAIMDHPNIAKVFDAGAADTGRPYFVMELVKGEPITEFCDRNQLPPRERLELFSQVCRAVQHAHQKGIIHRDIKPTNVLVGMHDTTPVVKVIDFGVAKALGQELTDKTLFTGFAQFLGTPLYMSPEQAGQSVVDVDTRSDIYSLGVLLYELLTGTTPFDKERFKKAAQDEIYRIIREEEPPKPSTRLSESKESLPSISAQRHTQPAKLTKLVRGELDWIVMKALEKDRARRYETAIGMARDIERYLRDEPIEACPPSAVYRLTKFARRNKGPVLAAAVVLLTLVGGIVGTTLGLLRAEQARRVERQAKQDAQEREAETNAVLDFVENNIFAAARPEGEAGGLGHDVTLRRTIESALPFVDKSFTERPLIQARLRRSLGLSFRFLGEGKIAAEQLEAARALYTTHLGPDHPDTLKVRDNLAVSYLELRRYDEALKLSQETLALCKAKLGLDHPTTLNSMHNLSVIYCHLGRYVESGELVEQTLALTKAKLGRDHVDTLKCMISLADNHDSLGRHAESLKLYEELLPLAKTRLGPNHRVTLNSMVNVASSYDAVGRHAEALMLRDEAVTLMKAQLGPAHPETQSIMNEQAWKLVTVPDSSLRNADRAVELAEEAVTHGALNANYWNTLGVARYRSGDFEGAIAALEKFRELRTSDAEWTNPFFLAMAHWQLGNKDEAREWYDKGAEWMDEKNAKSEAMLRFRAEAAELLRVKTEKRQGPSASPETESEPAEK